MRTYKKALMLFLFTALLVTSCSNKNKELDKLLRKDKQQLAELERCTTEKLKEHLNKVAELERCTEKLKEHLNKVAECSYKLKEYNDYHNSDCDNKYFFERNVQRRFDKTNDCHRKWLEKAREPREKLKRELEQCELEENKLKEERQQCELKCGLKL